MSSTYSSNLKIELITTGEQDGTWGTTTNTNLGTALEQAIIGRGNPQFTSDANLTISLTDSPSSQTARCIFLYVDSTTSLSATRSLIVPTIQKTYIVHNATSGSQSILVKTTAGTGITVPNGKKMLLYVDGTNVIEQVDYISSLVLGAALPVTSGGTGVTTSTGSGNVVLSTSPTLVTPVLGTPSSGTLTNCTGLPIVAGTTGTLSVARGGTGVTTSTGSGNVVLSTSPTLVTPALGTPSSGTLTNCTGLPVDAGTTGTLPVARGGTGVTTSTGSGSVVLNINPDLDEPFIKNNGASYPECAAFMGVGANNIGFGWTSPDVYVSVDNAVYGVVASISDYRLKKDIQTYAKPALEVISKIRVVDYEVLNLDGSQSEKNIAKKRVGVIAHEIQALIPDAASGIKDAVNADGSPRYQSVNYDAVVPYLIKTIQELTARIEKLEG